MKKIYQVLFLFFFSINILSIHSLSLKDGTIYEIDENIPGTTEYKTKTMSFQSTDTVNYFKYEFATVPSSLITAFKLDIAPYSSKMDGYKVLCTSVASSASDSDLISALNEVKADETKSTCLHIYQNYGYCDSIIKLDKSKPKIGIAIYILATDSPQIKINLRIVERILGVDETRPEIDESYSLIPMTIDTQKFRENDASKILFYSPNIVFQMYESVSNNNFPTKLFVGNILNVYTNPNMIRQKYHDASIMTLIPNGLGFKSDLKETFKFQVIKLKSEFLLDYYVSSNIDGRPLNSPLLINMTECTNPYYVILNYNAQDNGKTLILDEIYGKLSYLGVATSLEQETWEEMIEKDIKSISLDEKKYSLPISANNMDVYKLQCDLPIMLNFYYIDELSSVSTMKEGDVQIFNLQPYQIINVPFVQGILFPEILIEINQPENSPHVIIDVTDEKVFQYNTLERYTPMSLSDGITIKERKGSSDTRVIIKVGYSTNNWEQKSANIKYNSKEGIYLFEFPNDEENKYFYTYVQLTMSGENTDNNVKFCFTSSIGGALKPSSENCYRVSKDNSYTLKLYNPLIMYKNYEYSDDLKYSVTLKPVTEAINFDIKENMTSYDTHIRNYEGVNNVISITSDGYYSSILTPPTTETISIFLQIQICDAENSVKTKVLDILTKKELLPEEQISPGQKNKYRTFLNRLMDTQFYAYGNPGTNVFLRMVGITSIYTPSFSEYVVISFDESSNMFYIESPFTTPEYMKVTVLIDKENVIKNKGYTLCSFVGKTFDELAIYYKTVEINNAFVAYTQINFSKAGLKPGDKFDAIIYYEQLTDGQMVFLSDVKQGTVGEITFDIIHQINETFSEDENYLYTTIDDFDTNYYFSYMPKTTFDVPIGSFSLELDDKATGSFSGVYCTFVSEDADAMTMIEEVENSVQEGKSYCIGSKSSLNERRYNYIFKYEYEKDKTPKKMVIKVVNANVNGVFNLYMKTDQGEEVTKTDFDTQKEYGKDESNKMSVVPYIVNVEAIRGTDEDKVSKVLFYSKYLELQMYYIPTDSNAPIKLFSGNIGLVYTKPELAEQKYHSKILILITENLEGKTYPSIGGNFRFHTKMFHSNSMIEFFVSQNPEGRTLNFPLSLEMTTCSSENNKLYYLLNYNKQEDLRNLHLDMIFGNYLRARIATEINQEYWDELLLDSTSMKEISDFKADLPSKPQHIDIIEVECETPLLMNAYYTKDDYIYTDIERGQVVIKMLPAKNNFNFSFKTYDKTRLEYTISVYNSAESPDITASFSDGSQHHITRNSLESGEIFRVPQSVNIINNGKSETRFIFKFGLGVENNWQKEKRAGIEGTLYFKDTSYVYKFPITDNKYNYKTVDFLINSINDNPNTKFCYSTNLANAIDTSRENCFRTGRYIPYTLSFINPLIMGKNYFTVTDRYYISFKPFEGGDSISITITENQYDIKTRNELGKAKELTISSGKVSSILTMPKERRNIIFQIQSCKSTTNPIQYNLYNAFNGVKLHTGKIYFTDPYGIYYISELTYMENQIELVGENINMFTKHADIDNNYSPNINKNYSVIFDSSSNVLTIIKPILGEAFTFTVIIKDTSLESLTICDLAFSDKSKLGDYVKTFTSTTSDMIIHYVDFSSIGYTKGKKFWALIHAEQMQNSKMEFIYPVITGEVGSATGTIKIEQSIEGEYDYYKADFKVKLSSNYLYYDFTRTPIGNVASIRIQSDYAHVSKVGCTFVSNTAGEEEMMDAVNKAMLQNISCCIGDSYSGNNGFDALINAKYEDEKNRLVIQILYAFSENEQINEDTDATIIIKNKGTDLSEQGGYPSQEPYSAVPYVIDLLKIRGTKQQDYVSKILFYSSTREMQMFYIVKDSPKPITLFTGNIMLVYTNEELIKQKYQGATTMILLTDALSHTETPSVGEKYRFITYFFKSDENIQYFVSSNSEGRPLNNPTAIEMTSCTKPYYYIMNYNKVEGKRKLHIDTVFGEKKQIKLATNLNAESWDSLLENMNITNGNEFVLEKQDQFHFDVIEVTCNVPLLINLFYVEPDETKVKNLKMGDITVLSLGVAEEQTLTFLIGGKGPFVYSFTVEKVSKIKPNIVVEFSEKDKMNITENGVYTRYSMSQYDRMVIKNKELSGQTRTRVIFKFGFAIEMIFDKDENGIYWNKNDTDREYNLYGYIYDQTATRYDYTGIDFEVSTEEDNVKFCYSTNLGTYIYPSLQNCYRVGKNNPYTISTLNPNIMYRNYTSEIHMNYYVGFRTVNKNQNIIITPIVNKYDTTERNMEGTKNKVTISSDEDEISTILTAPKNHEKYIFVETCLCTKRAHISYQFFNAYNHSNLGNDGQLNNNNVKITVLENPKLDTELRLYNGKNGDQIFVKHSGCAKSSRISPQKIVIKYDPKEHNLSWTSPLINEKFLYQIYIDKIGVIKKQNYTLCHIAEVSKLGHHKEEKTSDSRNPYKILNFSQPDLGPDYGDFDIIIVAEQLENQKFTFLSATYDSTGNSDEDTDSDITDDKKDDGSGTKTGLIVIIVVLSVVIIGGGIAAVLVYLKYRKKAQIIEQNKQTSMAVINSTGTDKLVESQAQVD